MKKMHIEKKAEKCKYCEGEYTETYIKTHIWLKHRKEKVLERTYGVQASYSIKAY